jgi:hypothetical protein
VGAGSSKAHQSFAVAPAAANPGPTKAIAVPPAVPGGEGLAAVAGAGLVATSAGPPTTAPPEPSAPVPPALSPEMPPPDPDEAGDSGASKSGASWDDAATPVPATAPPGELKGVPLLAGGADLEDSLATLVAYQGPEGVREVLYATVAEDAEPKLVEALSLSEQKLVPVVVNKEINGRLPLDAEHTLYEQLAGVAKSVNHHLKAQDAIPAHTLANYEKAVTTLQELKAGSPTEAERQMIDGYLAAADSIHQRIKSPNALPYDQGGKVPLVEPHQISQLVAVTEYVPAPAEGTPENLRPAQLRDATRVAPSLDAAGVASWDGKARSKASGKEYAIDLGDGYTAVYRPYGAAGQAAADFSHRGALEVVAPPGAGHGPQLVTKLGELNLVNRPLSKAEGEWAFLQRNVWAQQLDRHKAVGGAMAEAAGLDDAVTELLVAERQHEALGMGEKALHGFARSLRLEAEARALPHKVRLVREAVAKETGWGSGAALAASPGYDPTPRASGGWLTWDRFDVAGAVGEVDKAFGKRGLTHRVTGHNLTDLLTSGVLASSERRRLMGVASGKGMSETSDMKTGGAKSVFLRVSAAPTSGPSLHWADASRLLRRSDWYAYGSDHFGSLNPQSGHPVSGQTRSPVAVAGFSSNSGNEVMFKHGIDLLGAEAPTKIVCGSAKERSSILSLLKARGIDKLGGRSVEEVVVQ